MLYKVKQFDYRTIFYYLIVSVYNNVMKEKINDDANKIQLTVSLLIKSFNQLIVNLNSIQLRFNSRTIC